MKNYIESFDGYKLISEEYINSSSKLKIRFEDEEPFYLSFNSFGRGTRGKTNKKKIQQNLFKLPYEEVYKRIKKEGYTLLSKTYNNNRDILKIKNDKSNEIIYVRFNDFQSGHRSNKNKKLTYDEVKKNIESVDGYKLKSSEYKNSKSKLLIQYHDNEPFLMTYNAFSRGQRDPSLCRNRKKTLNEVKQLVEEKGFTLISDEYINEDEPLKIKTKIGKIILTSYRNLKNSAGENVKNSIGEYEINNFLSDNKIQFISQYRVDILGKRHLFDFFIPDRGIMIEYDGIQHFKPIDFFGGYEALEKRRVRDRQKDEWCEKEGIKLIRIKYTDQDEINNILQNEIFI